MRSGFSRSHQLTVAFHFFDACRDFFGIHSGSSRIPDGTIVRRFTPENQESGGYKLLKSNPQYLCCADFHGNIDLRSKDSLQVIHTFEGGAPNMINDMAVLGNQLVTCGFSEHYGRPAPHLYLRVYDLRMQKLIPQLLQMLFPPSFLKYVLEWIAELQRISSCPERDRLHMSC